MVGLSPATRNFECKKEHQFPLHNFDKIHNFIIGNFEINYNFEMNEMEQMSNV